uniref:protein-serine/threonine phosphatase n=1 Tax=Haemonchus contortus TaxID=6289 RepID=A0A7I4YV60_HAECO
MLWYRILAMVLTSKAENNIKCYDGRLSKDNIELVLLQPDRMCVIYPGFPGNDMVFNQRFCSSPGCHSNGSHAMAYCCCDKHACNTVSFYKSYRTSVYFTMYIGHCIILLIVIAKLLTLLIINYGHSIRCGDNYAKYSKKIHLDLTQFLAQPKMSSSEVNSIIDTVTKGSNGSFISLASVKMHSVITYSTNDRITYREAKDQAKLSGVDDASKMEDILTEVIRLGPCEIEWNYEIMIAILSRAYDVFSHESTLLELSVPIAIYGDIHGQYSDIWRWFHVNGWPPGTPTLFLGDYVDRGRHSTEVLMFVLLLKIVWPKSVFICRGNHEEEQVNKAYNFYSELKARFPKSFRKLYRKVKGVFSMMPIACLISNQIICMHGGLSPRIQTVAEIAAIQRPLTKDNKEEAYIDILWSDPHPSKWKYEPNTLRDPSGLGLGHLFGPIQIKKFVRDNKLSLIVRAHQPPMGGYERVGKNLLTIFSTPGYRVQSGVGSMGASLVIDEDGTMDVIRIQVGEQLKLKRQRYKMDKGDSYRDCGKPRLRKPSLIDEKYS